MNTIIKYLKIYLIFLRLGVTSITTYRASFVANLFVEFGYTAIFILFFDVVMGNVSHIGSWDKNEVLFWIGINTISSNIILGLFYIENLYRLPRKIRDGEIDFHLLRPFNSLFMLSSMHPHVISIIATIPGIFLIFYSLNQMSLTIQPMSVVIGLIILLAGQVIAYSVLTIFSSISFMLINGQLLPVIGYRLLIRFGNNPHPVYDGASKIVFFYIFPIVFFSSIPSETILHGTNWTYFAISIITATIFLFIAIRFWNIMIKYYSSASS